MSASMKFDNAQALQAYIRAFWPTIFTKMFLGFTTAQHITPFEGVKDQLVLTELIIGTLVQRWKKTFDPKTEVVDFKPRTLRVFPCKVDAQFYPQELEHSYLGFLRQKGFKVEDFPLEAYITELFIKKVSEEKEIAIWQGEATAAPADGDPLKDMIDGFLHIVADEILAGNMTAVTTAAHTTSNAVANAEAVHAALDPVYQQELTYMFCSYNFAKLYKQNYRASYGNLDHMERDGVADMIRLDFGNCYLVPTAGMGTSSRLIVTPASNLAFGYDAPDEEDSITIEKNHRAYDWMQDFKFGAQIIIVHDKIIRANNLT